MQIHAAHSLLAAAAVAALAAPAPASAYYEEVDGYPSMQERQIHLFTDMLRVEPMALWDGEGEYAPVRPLIYNADLNHAAYAYAHDMRINGCWNQDHSSCDGTSMEDRVSSYYSGWIAIAENIAMGYTTSEMVVFDGWLYSDGHRANMLHPAFNELGTGYDAGGAGGPWYVQDFGKREGVEEPLLTSGAHWPYLAPVGQPLAFHATWYDPDGTAPESVWVAVGDACHEMELEFGAADAGVYTFELPEVAEGGCLPYAFVAELPGGGTARLPGEGALLARADGWECDGYQAEPPPAPCTAGDEQPEAGGCQAAEPRGCDGGGGPDVLNDNEVEHTDYGTCAQSRPTRGGAPFSAVLLFGGVLLAARRLVRSLR